MSDPQVHPPKTSPARRLASGVLAAAFVGVIWGGLESAFRLWYYGTDSQYGIREVPPHTPFDAVCIVVLSGFQYAAVGAGIGLAALLLLAPLLRIFRRADAEWRAFVAPRFAVWFAAIFFNLYWWSRFFIDFARSERFYSQKRLLLTAGWAVAAAVAAALVVYLLAKRRRSASPARAVVIAAVCLLGAVAWIREQVKLADQPSREDALGRYNVVLFVIDALRAQQLGCYGYERDTSPRIDALAREGVVFERAVVQAPYTWTSFGTLFTGKWPRRHGLMKMDPTLKFDPRRNNTLQSILDGYDYRTGAFLTGMLSNASGLIDGFETYFESMVGRDPVRRSSVWSFYRSELVLRALWNKVRQALDPTMVADEAIDWIRANKDSRFLSVIHLYPTHTPYDPPDEFDVFSPGYDGPLDKFTHEHAVLLATGQWQASDADIQRIKDLYDGGVLFADSMVGKVVDALEEEGVLDETIVVIASDHGEELGEHGCWEHNWMYNTNLLVPLIFRMPDGQGAGVRVDTPVEYRDILPTLLDLCELRETYEQSLMASGLWESEGYDGESLRDWFRGLRPKGDDFCVSENNYYIAVQNRRWKLIKSKDDLPDDPPRLFDLENDPHEMVDLYREDHPALPPLLEVFEEYHAIDPPKQAAKVLDETNARLMGQLGYTGGYAHGVSRREGQLEKRRQLEAIREAHRQCDCGEVCIEPSHAAYCDCGERCRDPRHKPPRNP